MKQSIRDALKRARKKINLEDYNSFIYISSVGFGDLLRDSESPFNLNMFGYPILIDNNLRGSEISIRIYL